MALYERAHDWVLRLSSEGQHEFIEPFQATVACLSLLKVLASLKKKPGNKKISPQTIK